MMDSPSAAASAAASEIIARRDQLLAVRAKLRAERQEILATLRRIERDLADCKAVARFFGLEIEFPSDEDDDADRTRIIEMERAAIFARRRAEQAAVEAKHSAQIAAERARATAEQAIEKASETRHHHMMVQSGQFRLDAPDLTTPEISPQGARPTLREAVISRLAAAGDRGSKAATIREWFETTFGKTIHEKTVGMTLYRLQTEGLVRREGHTWFLAPPKAETGNPGGETPGPINSET